MFNMKQSVQMTLKGNIAIVSNIIVTFQKIVPCKLEVLGLFRFFHSVDFKIYRNNFDRYMNNGSDH